MTDEPILGIERFEVAVAAMHSCGIATVLAVALLLVDPFDIHEAVGGRSLLLGLLAGVFFLRLAPAARRPQWTPGLEAPATFLCALSGLVAGVAWPFIVLV